MQTFNCNMMIKFIIEVKVGVAEMKKTGKFLKLLFTIVSLVVTAFNIFKAIYKGPVSNFVELTNLMPLFIAFYETSDVVYTWCNRFWAWLKCKTVSFETSFTIYNDEDRDNKKINKCISNGMEAANLKYDNGSIREIKNDSDSSRFIFKTNDNLKIALKINLSKSEQYQNIITISLNFQVSSRTLNDSWKIFKTFKDGFMTKTNTDRQRYDLDIDMKESGFNPFYRLTLKSVDSKDIEKVNLKFREKNAQINIYKNRIVASSSECSDLDEILKKYIPLTNVY